MFYVVFIVVLELEILCVMYKVVVDVGIIIKFLMDFDLKKIVDESV